jgi:hypothetical protein
MMAAPDLKCGMTALRAWCGGCLVTSYDRSHAAGLGNPRGRERDEQPG